VIKIPFQHVIRYSPIIPKILLLFNSALIEMGSDYFRLKIKFAKQHYVSYDQFKKMYIEFVVLLNMDVTLSHTDS